MRMSAVHLVTTLSRSLFVLAVCGLFLLSHSNTEPAFAASLSGQASEVLLRVNQERSAVGRRTLVPDSRLMQFARTRAEELIQNFSHTRPDGREWSTIFSDNNYKFSSISENIAMGQRSPKEAMASWMNSDGHRKNIMQEKADKIGVAVSRMPDGTLCWVQLFAR